MLIPFAPYILLAGGIIALLAGRRCLTDPGRAGFFAHPAAAVLTVTFLLGMNVLTALWFARTRSVAAGFGGAWGVIFNICLIVGLNALYAPLLAYHLGDLFASILSTESPPLPEPSDPFERARAAEDRGDVRSGVERYMWLLKQYPSHVDARSRLAELLAGTGRPERARELIDEGMALADVGEEARAEWRELKARLLEGGPTAAPRGALPRHRALGEVTTPRLDALRDGEDEGALPFEEEGG